MKVYVSIERYGAEAYNPLQTAFTQIIRVFGGEIVENADAADLALTNSPRRALSLLKESEEVRVIVCPLGAFHGDTSDRTAAESLAAMYPDRVMVRHIFNKDVAMEVVPSLIILLGQEATK